MDTFPIEMIAGKNRDRLLASVVGIIGSLLLIKMHAGCAYYQRFSIEFSFKIVVTM